METAERYGVERWTLREPCRTCGAMDGVLHQRGDGVNKQNVVFCHNGHWVYNAPKNETGEKPVTVATSRTGVTPSQRRRVLERATGRCEICGSDEELQVSHLVSLKDGRLFGLSPRELNCDDNLAAMCASCNHGLNGLSVHPRLYVALLRRRVLD